MMCINDRGEMMTSDTKDIQQLISQAQLYQQQMQNIMVQKESLNIQLIEISKALEELEKSHADNDVYRIAGPILIKSGKTEVKKDLKEKEDVIRMRLKTIETGEKRVKDKIEEIRDKMSDPKKKSVAE